MLAGEGEFNAGGIGSAGATKQRIAATLRLIHGVKRCTKSRTACALTPTGTTISTRPPTCTRAVSRRARGLTRTANGSFKLRVSNKDSCVPCGFIAPNDTRLAPNEAHRVSGFCQLCQLTLRRLVIRRRDQGLFNPVARAQMIAALLQLRAERQVGLRMSPARRVDTASPRIVRKVAPASCSSTNPCWLSAEPGFACRRSCPPTAAPRADCAAPISART